MTTAIFRPVDQQRAGRLLLGWLRGDRLAIDTVLNEGADDPIGTPDLVIAMTSLTAELARVLAPENAEQQIERALLHIANDNPNSDAGGDRDELTSNPLPPTGGIGPTSSGRTRPPHPPAPSRCRSWTARDTTSTRPLGLAPPSGPTA